MAFVETALRQSQRTSLGHTLRKWVALARQRRDLANLDQAALHDIGLTAHEAKTEANRPVWDAPQNWYL